VAHAITVLIEPLRSKAARSHGNEKKLIPFGEDFNEIFSFGTKYETILSSAILDSDPISGLRTLSKSLSVPPKVSKIGFKSILLSLVGALTMELRFV
jgi:hypothetical protein